jgi:hypothetical protein
MITRTLSSQLRDRFFGSKALILLGPRQVGKTTLLKELLRKEDHLFLNGDDPAIRNLLAGAGLSRLQTIIGRHRIVFIDEAQRIPEIGITLKLITDQLPGVQVLVSGSSALELNQTTQEPLTGLKIEYRLYPISWEELETKIGFVDAEQQLEERLVFGMYPEVVSRRDNARETLRELCSSYLYKDVLAISGIRKPEILEKLLRALALQLGQEVSYNELAGLIGVDKNTVARYIELLEKTFIVFRLNSYSRNLRNEIRGNRKIYFYDNGIRNAIIENLNPLSLRNDKGALWENFLINERMKYAAYHGLYANRYFWRTVQQQEIDLVEETGGRLFAYEFTWNHSGRKRIPKSFLEHYSAEGRIIDRSNFREFVMPGARLY